MRRILWMKVMVLLCVGALSACEGEDELADDAGSDIDSGTGEEGWQELNAHPCSEYRVNAMLAEDDGETLWIGCGEGTTGFGIFMTSDGGASWSAPATEPAEYFDTFRVLSVQRAADGLLYVAGTQTTNADRVVALDTTSTPYSVDVIWEPGTTVDESFTVGTFRRNSEGRAVAESLTGNGMVSRDSDEASFAAVAEQMSDGVSRQVLDMQLFEDEFYGTGSTIAQPHAVFLPPSTDSLALFEALEFDTSGELWGLAIDDSGLAAAGVEQSTNTGIVYFSGDDLYSEEDWTRIDASTVATGTGATRFYGVCRRGDTIAAVGDYSQRSDALIILSLDGGETWSEISPEGGPIIDECYVTEDGSLLVVGGAGFAARYQP